jgi:hypothetical protein
MHRAEYLRDAPHVNKMFYILVDDLFYEPYDRHYAPSNEFSSLVEGMLHDKSTKWEIDKSHVSILASINAHQITMREDTQRGDSVFRSRSGR